MKDLIVDVSCVLFNEWIDKIDLEGKFSVNIFDLDSEELYVCIWKFYE